MLKKSLGSFYEPPDLSFIESQELSDELTALSSIFFEDFQILSPNPLKLMISLTLTVPEQIKLWIERPYLRAEEGRRKNIVFDQVFEVEQHKDETMNVSHLPPLLLHLDFSHTSYCGYSPSSSSSSSSSPIESLTPQVSIEAPWLSKTQLRVCLMKLRLMAVEDPSEQLLFRWINWLKEESFSFLASLAGNKIYKVELFDHLQKKRKPEDEVDDEEEKAFFDSFFSSLPSVSYGDPNAQVFHIPLFSVSSQEHRSRLFGTEEVQQSPNPLELPEITLSPDESLMASLVINQDARLHQIMHHQWVQEEREFQSEKHMCEVCFDQVPGDEFPSFVRHDHSCRHRSTCNHCIRDMILVTLEKGNILDLTCPMPDCTNKLSVRLMQALCPNEFEKIERFLSQRAIERTGGLVYCVRESCQAPIITDELDEDDMMEGVAIVCPVCSFAFCTNCRKPTHTGSCVTVEIDKNGNVVVKGGIMNRGDDPEKRRRGALSLIRNRLKLDVVFRENTIKAMAQVNVDVLTQEIVNYLERQRTGRSRTPKCPGCHVLVEKESGCNKMTCTNCGKYFCWHCLKVINGYDHFQQTPCPLFPGVLPPVNMAIVQDRIRLFLKQIDVDAISSFTRICPTCFAPSIKINANNRKTCEGCQGEFCFVCEKAVANAEAHWKEGGCPINSPIDVTLLIKSDPRIEGILKFYSDQNAQAAEP